jgi:acetylornithine/succinyldiaminopimelate/putrescine aminotransferase
VSALAPPTPATRRVRRGEGCALCDADGTSTWTSSRASRLHARALPPARRERGPQQAGRLMHVSNLFTTRRWCGSPSAWSSARSARRSTSQLRARKPTRRRSSSPQGPPRGRRRGRPRRLPRAAPTGRCRATPAGAKQAPFAPLVPGFRAVAPEAGALAAASTSAPPPSCSSRCRASPGVHPLDEDVLRAAREACDRRGARSCSTRSSAAWGGPGTLWAYEQTGVVPTR